MERANFDHTFNASSQRTQEVVSFDGQYQDELTGLPNRRAFGDALDSALENPDIQGKTGVIFIDLESFKSINDSYGHDEGDEYIRNAAGAIQDSLREDGTVMTARRSGDEFVVLVAEVNQQELEAVASRIQDNLDEIGAPVSVGASLHRLNQSPGELMRQADVKATVNSIERKLGLVDEDKHSEIVGHVKALDKLGVSMRDLPKIYQGIIELGALKAESNEDPLKR